MNIIIVNNYEEMSKKAAYIFVAELLSHPNSVLGLATGSTPLGLYEELIKYYNDKMISFEAVTTFNLDEYIGLAKDHRQSYAYFMRKYFFDSIDIHPEKCFVPDGTGVNMALECDRYDQGIKEIGGIDLQVLGIGRNGHIGFNEPDLKFESQTHIVKLDEKTITDNARFFKTVDEVPKYAVSMGIKTIMQSRRIVLLAAGREKAQAVNRMLAGEITPRLPASVLQLHPNATAIIEGAAASLLDIEKLKKSYQVIAQF